jgi:predicted transcriptional regulator
MAFQNTRNYGISTDIKRNEIIRLEGRIKNLNNENRELRSRLNKAEKQVEELIRKL